MMIRDHNTKIKGAEPWDILFCRTRTKTVWNVEGRSAGATDIAMTELGHEQAIATGKKILEGTFHADEILYSPIDASELIPQKHISEITEDSARMEPCA